MSWFGRQLWAAEFTMKDQSDRGYRGRVKNAAVKKKIGELHCGASSNEGESRFQSVRLRVKLFELTCGPSEGVM